MGRRLFPIQPRMPATAAARSMRYALLRLLVTATVALVVGSGCPRRGKSQSAGARPNVLLIVVDAMRADRLQCYGYGRRTSPNISKVAAEGIVFTNAMAQGAETPSSIPSLMTGTRPLEHGVLGMRKERSVRLGTGEGPKTLAETLRDHGYVTGAISVNPLVGAVIGVDRGFQSFEYPILETIPAWRHGSAADVNAAAYRWLDRYHPGAGPFFLYLHYIDTHNLYIPPSRFCVFGRPGYTAADDRLNVEMNDVFDPQVLGVGDDWSISDEALAKHGRSRSEVERLSDLYDDEVLCADYYIGELLQRLRQAGLYDNTIIIVTADHGEAFLEHGQLKHGGSLYQELIRVPLVMRAPGLRGGQEVDQVVELIDVAPTVLEAVGIGQEAPMSGWSFYRALVEGKRIPSRVAVAELPFREMYAVRLGDLKLITSPRQVELYDLAHDPHELRNLAREQPEQVARLKGALQAELARHPAAKGVARPPSEQEMKALRSLGYVK